MLSLPNKIFIITDHNQEKIPFNRIPKDHIFTFKQTEMAIETARQASPDIILIYAHNNVQQINTFCVALKISDQTKDIPVLLIPDPKTSDKELQELLHAGTDAIISNDINTTLEELINLLIKYNRQIKSLQKINTTFLNFFTHSPIHIFIKEISSTSNRIIYGSENLKNLFDIPMEEIIGREVEEYLSVDFARQLIKAEWDALSKGETIREEKKHNDRHYITINFPIASGENTLLGGFTIDITEQKLIEEALRNSEAHFRSIVDNSDAGYFFIDNDGIIQDVNQAWMKLYKYSTGEEIIGHHFAEIQRVEDLMIAEDFVNGIMRNDSNYLKGEFSRKCKDGSIGYHTFSARPVSRDNKVIGIEGFIIDTTDHRLAVEALRASEERYHLIDEASQDMIYSYDQNSRFTHANTFMCQRLELTLDQILGKTHEELGFPQALCDEWAVLHRQVYDTNATVIAETTAPIPDGTIVNYEVVLNPIHDGEGKIIGIAGTTRDIHERKLSEAKIKEQMLELRQWHTITMGREDRILELKREINQLLEESGKPPKYKSVGKEK